MASRVDLVCCRTTADFLRSVTWHAHQRAPPRWQAASAEIQVQTTFALRFSLTSKILAFRREHMPNAEQLNCWVYAFKLTYVSSCVELTVCRVDSCVDCRVDLCQIDFFVNESTRHTCLVDRVSSWLQPFLTAWRYICKSACIKWPAINGLIKLTRCTTSVQRSSVNDC